MGRKLREIRYFPDFGRKYPLWESGTEKYAMGPWDYDLSNGLASGLRELMELWSSHFTDKHGPEFEWDSVENERRYWDQGDQLLEKLRSEVADIAIVLDQRR